MEMTRSILKEMSLPNYLWGEAVRHATYLINRVPTRALKNQTPYECMRGKKPSVSHIRVFRCMAYAKIDSGHLRKLDDRSQALVHLGLEPGSKAYRLYNPTSRQIVVSRDVIFDEKACWNWKGADKEVQYTPGMFHMSWGSTEDNGSGPYVVGSNNEDVVAEPETETNETAEIVSDTVNDQEPIQEVIRSNRQTSRPSYLEDYVMLADLECEILLLALNNEPLNIQEALKSKRWKLACIDEIDSIYKNETWILVEKPQGVKVIGLKWIFKVKRKADGSINKFKSRLVAKGYVQEHRIDFDEVFAPVARIETIRLLIGLAATNGWEIHHLDVKKAFLHGELIEEVYVSQPEGFSKKGEEHKVFKLKKALYGLRQAPRAWNTKLDQILKGLKFKKCSKESSVYRKDEKDKLLIVVVYVDNLFVTGSSVQAIMEFKNSMSKEFEMCDLGRLTYYLGIEVRQSSEGIEIKQEAYARQILKDAGMDTCNASQIPMEFGLKISKAIEEPEIEATVYRRRIGCLRYLRHTKPDLTFSVGILSRYMHTPRKSHGDALKQMLRYLKGTLGYGLKFKSIGSKKLLGYSDSSHNTDLDDGKSTTGHIFCLGDTSVT